MKANKHDAGVDIYCKEKINIHPGETVSVEINPIDPLDAGLGMLILPRSSYRAKGLVIMALYDAGYVPSDGRYSVYTTNASGNLITLEANERFAQGIVFPVIVGDWIHLTNPDIKRVNKQPKAVEYSSGILELKKTWRVRTGHKLTFLPEGHKCLNPHGEYYTITITLRSYDSPEELEGHMLMDFGEIDKIFKSEVYDFLDHSFLICKDDPNVETYKTLSPRVRVLDYSPTAEYLSKFIFDRLYPKMKSLVEVEVIESMDNSAKWRIRY